jgi:ASC-1-like (ASCH) protein
MSEHTLKLWPQYFDAVADGRKRFEVRSTRDRTFAVGDVLVLREWDPKTEKILARLLYFEMRRGFVAVVAAHVLGAVVVGFLGVTYSGRWWPNVLVALITGRLAWWLVDARRNLGVARLIRDEVTAKAEARLAEMRRRSAEEDERWARSQ